MVGQTSAQVELDQRDVSMFHRVNGSQDSLSSGYSKPTNANTRRMTQPNLFPPSPDTNTQRSKERSGSPLRHSITASPQSEDGSPLPGRYDSGSWGDYAQPGSPTLGATFARVANSLVSSLRSQSVNMQTDDEIEAQAIREREHSRREAERILTREAEERRVMEEKILAMRGRTTSQTSLALSQSGSNADNGKSKEEQQGWWQTAKNRLSTSKDLTPAQQIIQDSKVKEKEAKKNKGKEPKTPTKRSSDTSLLHLDIPSGGGGYRRDTSPSPTQEHQLTPHREIPSSARTGASPGVPGISPAKSLKDDDNRPVYAKYTALGSLDVNETLLTITKRFEKLERWTVGHVRALEDRVGDVEKWLVDKEEARQAAEEARERDKAEQKRMLDELNTKVDEIRRLADEAKRSAQQTTRSIQQNIETEVDKAVAKVRIPSYSDSGSRDNDFTKKDIQRLTSEVGSIRDSLAQLQTKYTELSRMSASSSKSGDAPRSHSPALVQSHSTGGAPGSVSSRSRLPYPSGDYAAGDGVTPPASPPPLTSNGSRSFVGSPPTTPALHSSSSYTSLNAMRPQPETTSSYTSLSLPPKAEPRPSSTSPTPRNRKRYTVALGGPLTSPLDRLAQDYEEANKDMDTGHVDDSPPRGNPFSSSAFSRDSPSPNGHAKEDTIGGTPIDLARVATVSPPGSLTSASRMRGTESSPGSSRIRAQSAYGAPAGWNSISQSLGTTQPLRPRRRSGDLGAEFGAMSDGGPPGKLGSVSKDNKFVDPLVRRRQEREQGGPPKLPVPKGKANFGDLLAFFDGDKK